MSHACVVDHYGKVRSRGIMRSCTCVSSALVLAFAAHTSGQDAWPACCQLPRLLSSTPITVNLRGGASGDEGAYSFSLTTFSSKGSLKQIEYAMNAALVSKK